MGATLILDHYTGTDHYSDGDVEDELLKIVKHNKDFEQVLAKDNRWPILYHLSPIRQNIVNWYPFDPKGSCLEIGAGCGAITGALCDRLAHVTAVELSKRRATILYERHKDRDNLEIVVGNLNDIPLEKKYEYVTLIGVLEYAGSFTKTDNPYADFLKKMGSYLKEGGKLILAIENRFGMKYFAGAKEDHTAKEYDGIEGYPGIDWVRTFGKKELEELLLQSGYEELEFYYPHPDYKMPMEIYTPHRLPTSHTKLSPAPNFDYERFTAFDESKAFAGVCANGEYEFFANSFLVIGTKR